MKHLCTYKAKCVHTAIETRKVGTIEERVITHRNVCHRLFLDDFADALMSSPVLIADKKQIALALLPGIITSGLTGKCDFQLTTRQEQVTVPLVSAR